MKRLTCNLMTRGNFRSYGNDPLTVDFEKRRLTATPRGSRLLEETPSPLAPVKRPSVFALLSVPVCL